MIPALHRPPPRSTAISADQSPDVTSLGVISPELVLVDPELARKARALLPDPPATFPERTVALPSPPRPAPQPVAVPRPRRPPLERLPPRPPPRLRSGRRLVAAASLLPVLLGLALVADFVRKPGNPRGATTPASEPQAPSQPTAQRQAKPPAKQPSAHKRRAVRKARSSGPSFSGNRIEGLVNEIGSSRRSVIRAFGAPGHWDRNGDYCAARWDSSEITVMFAAHSGKNPCTKGHVIGGFATGTQWRTAEGLSVGSSLVVLRERYPHAASVGSGWWKLGAIRARGSRSGVPLHAHVTAGRVDKLLVN